MLRLKRFYKRQMAERRRCQEINIKLEALTDYGFLDRAVGVSK